METLLTVFRLSAAASATAADLSDESSAPNGTDLPRSLLAEPRPAIEDDNDFGRDFNYWQVTLGLSLYF